MTKKTENKKKNDCLASQDRTQKGGGLFLWPQTFRDASLIFLFACSLLILSPSSTQAEAPSDVRMLSKSIHGQVGARTSQGFALITQTDSQEENEMWLPFQQAIQFIGGYSKPADLAAGDRVMVGYEESQDGTKRILKSITLIKKGETPAVMNSSSNDDSAEPTV